jgi:phthalate 4,5-dioxygenase
MLTTKDNLDLCLVGNGTVMGNMLRQYWYPVLSAADLAEPGGPPQWVRLLGENLVAFRASDGQLGLVDAYCPHRGASLVLARNEDCGLRCIYHGWLIDPAGRILDTPNEPEESNFKDRVRHIAYGIREAGGLIWAYIGPVGKEPPFPNFEWTAMEPSHVGILRVKVRCNWVQVMEGLLDSSHSSVLHSGQIRSSADTVVVGGGSQFQSDSNSFALRPSNDSRPRIDVEDTGYGFRYAATRRTLKDPELYKYVRTTLFVAPVYAIIPGIKGWGVMQFPVPIDDHNTLFYNAQYCYDEPVDPKLFEARNGARPDIDVDPSLTTIRHRDNQWLQDRAAMSAGTSFSGVYGIMNEDIAVQESMGPIYDRSREHLGTADRALIHFRRIMLRAARDFANGGAVLGQAQPVSYADLRAEDRVMSIDEPWERVGAAGLVPAASPGSMNP